MRNTLNTDHFAAMIRAKRGARGLRETAAEIGDVSPSTLSRVENGSTPDTDIFLTLCDWLEMPAGEFLDIEDSQSFYDVPTVEKVALLIRADKSLNEVTAAALVEVVRAVYRGGGKT